MVTVTPYRRVGEFLLGFDSPTAKDDRPDEGIKCCCLVDLVSLQLDARTLGLDFLDQPASKANVVFCNRAPFAILTRHNVHDATHIV